VETVPLREHLAALRDADRRFYEERDRRYAEVAGARAEALKIKEEADKVALELARQIQTYKDEQHNGLLQQLDRDRAKSVTQAELKAAVEKLEATIDPLGAYFSNQRGVARGVGLSANVAYAAIVAAAALAAFLGHVIH
jgi:uncharacterized protein YaaW (UPF0174 family)